MKTETFHTPRPRSVLGSWAGLLLTIWALGGVSLLAWRVFTHLNYVGAIPDNPDIPTPLLLTISLPQLGLIWLAIAVPLLVLWIVSRR